MQKENNPKEEHNNRLTQQTVLISVVNDLQHEKDENSQHLSLQETVDSNTKVLKKQSSSNEKRIVEITEVPILESLRSMNEKENLSVDKDDVSKEDNDSKFNADDYKSPLDAFGNVS